MLLAAVSQKKNPNVINVFQNVSKNVSYFHFLYFFGGEISIYVSERGAGHKKNLTFGL